MAARLSSLCTSLAANEMRASSLLCHWCVARYAAQRKATFLLLSIVKDIESVNDLYWHRQSKKKEPYPVRICKDDEAVGLIDKEWNPLTHVLVQYLGETDDNQRMVVKRNQLVPYHGHHNDTNSSSGGGWCLDTMNLYIKGLEKKTGRKALDPVQLRVEELYLAKLFQRVHEKEAQVKMEQEKEEALKSCDDDEDDTEDSSGEIANQPRSPAEQPTPTNSDGAPDKKEKLRAGDVIEYTNTQFVAGNKEGYRRTKILAIRNDAEYKLVLENGELLPKEHWVRRIRRLVRGQLVPYNGIRRAIQDTPLQYCKHPVTMDAGIRQEVKRVGDILDANVAKFQQALEETGMPLDLLQNVGKKWKNGGSAAAKENLASTDNQKMQESDDNNRKRQAENGPDYDGHKRGVKRVRELSNETTSSRSVKARKDAKNDCVHYLEEELHKFKEQSGSSRRRCPSCHSTMTENQLGLAIKLWHEIVGKTAEEVSKFLSKETDIDDSQMEKFLSGDPNRLVRADQHKETEIALTEWMNKRG